MTDSQNGITVDDGSKEFLPHFTHYKKFTKNLEYIQISFYHRSKASEWSKDRERTE